MENKKPYVNYSARQQEQIAKQTPKPETVEDVAVNAPVTAPAVNIDTEKREEKTEVRKPIERVDNIAKVVKEKVVTVASLNVRSNPNIDAPNIIGQLKMGAKVNVIEEVGEFSKIGEGKFVMTKFID